MTVEGGQKQNDEEEKKSEEGDEEYEDANMRVSESVRQVLSAKNGGGGLGGGRVVEKNGSGGAGSPLSQTNGEKEPTIEQMIKKVGREIYDMLPQL